MDNCNKVSKAPFDPGWNDPPKLSYNAQQPAPGRPRNFLNKRVAFPLSGPNSSSVVGPTPPINLPPMPNALPAPFQNIQTATNLNTEHIDSESTLAETRSILVEFLESSAELGAKANDIRKRIGVMEDMWITGRLDKQVQAKMKELAIALKNDEPSKADDLHRALMVDHVSAVGTWMPGVKQLIHHCIARSELLALDKETQDTTTE